MVNPGGGSSYTTGCITQGRNDLTTRMTHIPSRPLPGGYDIIASLLIFLLIFTLVGNIQGRNRRRDGDKPSKKFNRYPTGKKGLGKLAMFGLAEVITVRTVHNSLMNEFVLDWKELMSSTGAYNPRLTKSNEKSTAPNGTIIILTELKRKTAFNVNALADSLSKIFIFDDTFKVTLKSSKGYSVVIDNLRKYDAIDREFDWNLEDPGLVPTDNKYHGKVSGELITAKTPLSPSSELRGITLYSRGKLVNARGFFTSSTSSHFFQYLTGWICVDFIDTLDEDVISTNRQSIDWDHPEMAKLNTFLSEIVRQVMHDWRKKRKEKKQDTLKDKTGIDAEAWLGTMPDDVKKPTSKIIELLSSESAIANYTPVVKALHEIVPEYPLLHWRHLHKIVKEKSAPYYQNQDYYHAFIEAMKKYISAVREKSDSPVTPDISLMGAVFNNDGCLNVIGNYRKQDRSEFTADTISNIQSGQQHLSQGIVAGGRNPLAHVEIEELKKSDLFSEKDCLDLLSLLSHLFKRLDNSTKRDT